MNLIPIIPVKNHVRALFAVTFFILVNYSVPAQSKEDSNVLKSKINKAGNTSQKVELLLRLSAYYLNKDHEYKADLDEADILNGQARQLATSLHYKSGIGKSILLNAQINREKGDQKNGLKKAKEVLDYSIKNNLAELQADAYLELAMYGESLSERIKYKEMAIPILKKNGAKEKQADVLKEIGELHLMQDNCDKGLAILKESLLLYKSIKYPHLQGVYNLFSDGYTHTGNFAEALKYALLAEKTALAVHDSSLQLSSIYNHVGMAYLNLQKKNNAAEYFYKGLEIAKKHKSTDYVRVIGDNLCSVFILQKKGNDALKLLKDMQVNYPSYDEERQIKENYLFLGIYRVLNNNEKATIYYNKLVAYYGKNAEKKAENRMPILRSFVRYHYQLKNYTDLYPVIYRLDSLARASNNTIMLSDNYLIWFKADSSRGNYLDAIKHYQLYKNILDTIYKGETNKQINNLQIQFDTDKKDKNIDLLTQQAKVQQIQIQKDTVVRYVFIGSVVVLILFLAFLYNSFRSKKKKNEELEIQRQQINEQNELNKKMLIEKEWLLKEIHHRVKNNLQIVISLLNTQSAYLDNEDALMAIQNSQHRMHAMSLIHQKLYQSDNLANIDMSWYIYELINYMKECFDTDRNILFVLDTEKVYLDVAQAVPLGLIINEAINNTIKYAFPSGRKGEVHVSLKNTEANQYQLIIDDNGVGLPADFEDTERDSLGMNLMIGLSDQIDGIFDMKSDNGLKIKITFTRNTEFEGSSDNAEII
ncbi:two-component sensor histidine kinase [Flavobacterium sp. 9]|uniref:histidine kinase dimerization/phosphoacceptor domain -containing protein n=1 Tax=Flavobacterium sp. 9 TaxID=2035198 RepID=UPI000C190EC7|nr:histidine kinase dimerization/phosphoacceptor domain -containing protein [Flavobacterium sp. 9]PIF29673.1 two-component sensor histidine kinase [Flavobacterium sp. 9]